MLQNIENIFFDFDGVILDSVDCKTQAFYEMYLPYGEAIANEVKKYHLENGGVSRFKKFEFWEKKYFNRVLSKRELKILCDNFSKKVLNKVINSPKVKGVEFFLEKHYKSKNLFIITGTPTNEIKQITKSIGIDHFFKEILGSPETKEFWGKFIINKYEINRDKILFIGDALTDLVAAKKLNLRFGLRLTNYNRDLLNYSNYYFNDFNQLKNEEI